jgi:glyoxylase-like metal-dependent hydrolase (beta-lactamase superfamily II)
MSAGTYEAKVLRAGAFRLDGGGMFGVVPRVLWSGMAPPDERNRIAVQTNCLLLRDGVRTVLVESGYGSKWTEKDRDIFAMERRTVVDALAEVDVSPQAITHVFVTHLHFDHAAGLTSAQPGGAIVPTFPNAAVVVQRREWEDALENRSTMTKTYLRSHLDPVADQLRLVDGALEVLPGISVEPVPGHTWGQQAVIARATSGVVCFPGDVVPTASHAGPAFSMGYDMLPYENMRTKRALFERAMREQWLLVLDHEPGDPVRRVERDETRPDRPVLVSATLA